MKIKIYEYLDFYCYGVNERIIKTAGFEKNNFNKKIIVPNYFEPFEKRNVKLGKSKNEIVEILKGITVGELIVDDGVNLLVDNQKVKRIIE